MYRREKFLEVTSLQLMDHTAKNAIYSVTIEFISKDKIPEKRNYTLIIYLNTEKHDQLDQDIRHLKEIMDLNVYPIGKKFLDINGDLLSAPLIILENIPGQYMVENLRITLGLDNARAVGKRLERYLQKRVFSLKFAKRGHLLVNEDEKYQKIESIEQLALGLNNAVFSFTVEYLDSQEEEATKDLILRVYPQNENYIKALNEANNLRKIQDLDIPKAKYYLFEEDIRPIGYRFLILEKLRGNPVLESIHTFTAEQTHEFLADLARILGLLHNIRQRKFQSYYLDPKSTRRMEYSTYIYSEVSQVLKSFREMKLDQEFQTDTKFLFKWFKGHKPLLKLPGYSFIHGDLRPSNIIVNGYKISGLIDWEMSCYSDPAQDLGWTLFFFKLYKNLERERGFFFEQYWKYCQKYDFEARVFFYEFIAAIKLFIYAQANKRDNPEKYETNQNFFSRVEKAFPQYLETVTYKINEGGQELPELTFDEDMQREVEFKVRNLVMDTFAHDLKIYDEDIQIKIDKIVQEVVDLIRDSL